MKKFIFSLLIICGITHANASVIGQWNESNRSWNNGSFSNINSILTNAGHTIEADGALTAANLFNDDMFVLAEAARALTTTEISDLLNWISSGGILWMSVDSGSNSSFSNTILSALGSTLSLSGMASNSGPLAAGNFATNNVYNIEGQSINWSLGYTIDLGANGTFLSANMLAFEQIGNGFLYLSGDRFEHDALGATANNPNGQIFLNLAQRQRTITSVPAPATAALLLIGLLGTRLFRKS